MTGNWLWRQLSHGWMAGAAGGRWGHFPVNTTVISTGVNSQTGSICQAPASGSGFFIRQKSRVILCSQVGDSEKEACVLIPDETFWFPRKVGKITWSSCFSGAIKCVCVCVWCVFSRSVMLDSLQPLGMQPTGLLCSWNFPGKNTGVAGHFLLQGVFPTLGIKPESPASPALPGRVSTTEPPGKPLYQRTT